MNMGEASGIAKRKNDTSDESNSEGIHKRWLSEENYRGNISSPQNVNDSSNRQSTSQEQADIPKQLEFGANRKWWYSGFGKHHLQNPNQGLDFTVMSYNILSQDLLENNIYLYSGCKLDHLLWKYRSQNLLQEMQKHSADIICLQEVHEDHFRDTFLPFLTTLGYFGIYKKRTGKNHDGCAIFFKTRVFQLDDKLLIEYKTPFVKILDRDNVGLVVVLRPKDSQFSHLKLICATTHLLFNPRRGDIKLAQLRRLLAEVEKAARKESHSANSREYHPVIFCGDLNSEPFFPLYNFVVRGFIQYDNLLSGNISGQQEGFNKGRVISEIDLSLTSLGIDQNTCYDVLHSNGANKVTDSPSSNNMKLIQGLVFPCDTLAEHFSDQRNHRFCFFHPLNFSSTYKHIHQNRGREVSIGHMKNCANVDYIFYNVKRKGLAGSADYTEEEENLKHIGCYGLLYDSDYFEIPNARVSSDHMCLISRFLLISKD